MNKLERWVELRGSNGKYDISDHGNIKNNLTGKTLKGTIYHGYKRHSVVIDGKPVTLLTHIQVAKHFIPNEDNKPIVNHIDEDKSNPVYTNLEWATSKENANHGTRNSKISENTGLMIRQYNYKGEYMRTFKSTRYIANSTGAGMRAIQNAINNKTLCKGYIYTLDDDAFTENIDVEISEHQLRYVKNVECTFGKEWVIDERNVTETIRYKLDAIRGNEYLSAYQKKCIEDIATILKL